MLKFSNANAKTKELSTSSVKDWLKNKKAYSLDLISGWSCPCAKECLSKVEIVNGRKVIKDGPETLWRCFSASQEALYPAVYNLRKHNFDVLRTLKGCIPIAERILADLPKDAGIIRWHVGGDCFSYEYFKAWTIVANQRPNTLFYFYTKSLNFWTKYLEEHGPLPYNLVGTASRGGRLDHLIDKHNLREAKVIFSMEEGKDRPVDFTDEWAANPETKDTSFYLLLHGTMPKGSEAAKAWEKIKKGPHGGYNKKLKKKKVKK
jgi:hypothetical protein